MPSLEEAFLILKKWRDDPGPPDIYVFRPFPQLYREEMVLSGSTAQVITLDESSGIVGIGFEGEVTESINLTGATFEYADERSTPLVDGEYVCSLEARFSDDRLIVFAELPSVDD